MVVSKNYAGVPAEKKIVADAAIGSVISIGVDTYKKVRNSSGQIELVPNMG